jgi:hypothetical protein
MAKQTRSQRASTSATREDLRRRSYISSVVSWFGSLRRPDFQQAFGLSPATTTRILKDIAVVDTSTIEYRHYAHTVLRAGDHAPERNARANAMLGFLRAQELSDRHGDGLGMSFGVEIVDGDILTEPPVEPSCFSDFLIATRDRKALQISYIGREGTTEMIVSPTRIIYVMNRYHARCYSHEKKAYRDIVLSRTVRTSLSFEEWQAPHDTEWATPVTLRFSLNPELEQADRSYIANEWNLPKNGIVQIKSLEALAIYVKRKMTALTSKRRPRWVLIE